MARSFLRDEIKPARDLKRELKGVADETERLAGGMQSVNQAASQGGGTSGTTGRTLTGPVNLGDVTPDRGQVRGATGGGNRGSFVIFSPDGSVLIRGSSGGGGGMGLRQDPFAGVPMDLATPGQARRAREAAAISQGLRRGPTGPALNQRSDQLLNEQSLGTLLPSAGIPGGGDPGGGGGSGGDGGGGDRMQPVASESTLQVVASELRALRRAVTQGPTPGSFGRSR